MSVDQGNAHPRRGLCGLFLTPNGQGQSALMHDRSQKQFAHDADRPIPRRSLDFWLLIGELRCVIAASCDKQNTLRWLVIVSRPGKLRNEKCYHFTSVLGEAFLKLGKEIAAHNHEHGLDKR